MANYDRTPSFYNDEETFMKYLGMSSYYVALQNAVSKIIKFINPDNILELGSGTGATVLKMSKQYEKIKFKAIDMRQEMVDIGIELCKKDGVNNVEFEKVDMVDYICTGSSIPEFTYMLYSFHHIPDPLDRKIQFLKTFKENTKKGSKLCIAETFIPESINEMDSSIGIERLWLQRPLEGYASVFWASLNGLDDRSIMKSQEIGKFSYDNEKKAGELVVKRDNEYLVTVKWLCDTAKSLGYRIVIAEPCNNTFEYVVLLEC